MDKVARPLQFNGVNGSTGDYLFQKRTAIEIARVALSTKADKADQAHLRNLEHFMRWRSTGHLGVVESIDANALEQAGWGIIVPHNIDPRILEALGPLLKHRRDAAGLVQPKRYQEFVGHRAYRPGESSNTWLARQGVAVGPVDPDRGVPYYLLIVGSPDEIPFRFQYHLDVQHAVGRIHFDRVEDYRTYAESVVQAETRGLRLPQRVALAGVVNGEDQTTNLSAAYLLAPLARSLAEDRRFNEWVIEHIPPYAAKKAEMLELVGGRRTPPLLFTTSHGLGFEADDPRARRHQGALLCQDWPGHEEWGRKPIPEEYYLSADDIGADARVWGSIFFHFACFSAGTPGLADYAHNMVLSEPAVQAPQPFVAGLPRRLLCHEGGGALAVIGHVDRAWSGSFHTSQVASSVSVFADAIKRIMRGQRVGLALEKFNERYGQIATQLTSELEDIKFGKVYDDFVLADLWMANNDARAYAIVGDPAVRLVLVPDPPAKTRFEPLTLGASRAETGEATESSSKSGRRAAITMIYVAGPSAQGDDYAEHIDAIRLGLATYLPKARVEIEECLWGERPDFAAPGEKRGGAHPSDLLRYLSRDKDLREAILQRLVVTQAPIVLAHGVGGVACVDILATASLPWVKLLITAGSPAALLYRIDALPSLRLGQQLPVGFPTWLNLYHSRDPLGAAGETAFGPRIRDLEVGSQSPFPGGPSAYWSQGQTWRYIAQTLSDKVLG